MSAEYEGWVVSCDWRDPAFADSNEISEILKASCRASIRFDEPGVSENDLYGLLTKAGWTGPADGSDHDYCPAHPYDEEPNTP